MANKKSGIGFGFWISVALCIIVAVVNINRDDEVKKDFDTPVIMDNIIGDQNDDPINNDYNNNDQNNNDQNNNDQNNNDQNNNDQNNNDQNNNDQNNNDQNNSTNNNTSTGYRRMYNQLNTEEKKIYELVQQTVASGGLNVELDDITYTNDDALQNTIHKAVQAVYYDYPEFFWMENGSWSASWTSYGNLGTANIDLEIMCYDYWDYVSNPNSYINAVTTKATQIANEAAKQPTTYDKIKYVHDYLVQNVVYDNECLERLNQSNQPASCQQSHTVYGALVSNLAVCDGYAKTLQMIMNMLGIQCEFMTGDAGGPHAWNYMVIDGDTYWMDVTWDDSNLTDDYGNMAYPNGAQYDYYCITSNQLTRTHIPSPDVAFTIPTCVATDYNYFHYEDFLLNTYDFNSYSNIVSQQQSSDIINVQFGSLNELNRAVADLLTNSNWENVPAFGSEISYIINEDQYTLSIFQ